MSDVVERSELFTLNFPAAHEQKAFLQSRRENRKTRRDAGYSALTTNSRPGLRVEAAVCGMIFSAAVMSLITGGTKPQNS